jgi:hypothetical protein
VTPELKETLTDLTEQIRIAVSCCCSEHRYTEINQLLDQIEQVMHDAVRAESSR